MNTKLGTNYNKTKLRVDEHLPCEQGFKLRCYTPGWDEIETMHLQRIVTLDELYDEVVERADLMVHVSHSAASEDVEKMPFSEWLGGMAGTQELNLVFEKIINRREGRILSFGGADGNVKENNKTCTYAGRYMQLLNGCRNETQLENITNSIQNHKLLSDESRNELLAKANELRISMRDEAQEGVSVLPFPRPAYWPSFGRAAGR